jgi:alpha-N-arabinofuranosidase
VARAKLTVHLDQPIGHIRPEFYGHFSEHLGACVDEGIWVGRGSKIANVDGLRADVIEALRKIRVPVMRWPGGCFADDYHWTDGVGPREKRPRTVNIWWGQTVECNEFGTHEFMRFCELVGCKPYLAGNLGSGTVREMRDWVEYCNYAGDSSLARMRAANGSPYPFNVSYFGVGNENWGCGGNFCPEDYAAEFKRYATYLRDYGEAKLFLIACGPDAGSAGRHELHADWTRRFFKKLGAFDRIHGFAAHYYCGTAGEATRYTTDQWYELIERAARMRDVITTHRAVMDEFDPRRRIGLVIDEWGTWHVPPPPEQRDPRYLWQQQNTLRDALAAAVTLNVFNNHADQLVMCNVAQTANVLQALCLTSGERLVLTPTYDVFDLYQSHQGATALRTTLESPDVSFAVDGHRRTMPALTASASLSGGLLTLSVTNAHATLPQELVVSGAELPGADDVSVQVLSHDDLTAHNTFDEPDVLRPRSEPSISTGEILRLPPASVTVIRARPAR